VRRRAVRFAGLTAALTTATVLATGAIAWAADSTGADLGTTPSKATHAEFGLNLLWITLGAVLVIFMQAGFALVETGFCRAKHAAHVVSTNFAIFGLGFVAFFLVGYPLAFGSYSAPALNFGYDRPIGDWLVKIGDWGILSGGGWGLSGKGYSVGVMAFFLYMVAFMDTTATIPTGSMAERWKWKSFCAWGLFCGAIFYPLFANWAWGGGWLSQLWRTFSKK